jgi:choline monooxygenase
MNHFSIHQEISKAETLPAAFYRSDEVFNSFKEKVFAVTWHLVGNEKLFNLKTNLYPINFYPGFMDEPLLLTCDENDSVAALSNVCTHRGNVLINSPAKKSKLICGYHGRKFALDGKFEFMPEFKEAENFPSNCDNLPKIPLAKWKQFFFLSLNPAYEFIKIEKILNERTGFLPVENFTFKPELSREYLVNSHWALYCDNYLEGFHIPFVHNDLNEAIDYGTYETKTFEYGNLQIGYAKGGTEKFDLPEGHIDYGKNVSAYYYWIFPNLMLNFYPWGLSVNIVQPLTKDRCKVIFQIFMHDESKMTNSAGAFLDKVEREDEFVVESVQKGVNSMLYKAGRFSPKREIGVHHFHLLLSKFLG